MYRPSLYAIDDVAALHAVMRERVFATLALAQGEHVLFAYAPVIVDADGGRGRLRLHLAKANPMAAQLDGARVALSFAGPDAYVSPDWYAGDGFVPTWNYIAVEAEGRARRLEGEARARLFDDLSKQEEQKLAPKPEWTMAKLPPERITRLFAAIEAFDIALERLEGKFKLSQDKAEADIAGVIAGLEGRGNAASRAVAAAMRRQQR